MRTDERTLHKPIPRPVLPGVAERPPAPEPTARHGRVGSASAWKHTLVVIVAAAALPLGMALAAAAASAEDSHGQLAPRTAPDQSQREKIQARHRALGALAPEEPVAQPMALSRSERDPTLARHRALGALAAPPAATTTHPATPAPGVDVVTTLLVGLVGGLVGGALVVAGVAVTRPGRLRMRGAA